MNRKLKIVFGVASSLIMLTSINLQAQSSASFAIKGSAFVNSGGASSSPNFALQSAMGQGGILGTASSASFALGAGFLRTFPRFPKINRLAIPTPPQNTATLVRVLITDPQRMPLAATLYYRKKGETPYAALAMAKSAVGDTFRISIPFGDVTMQGLEFYVHATNGFAPETSPFEGADNAADLQVSVLAGPPTPTPDGVYQIVSFPFDVQPGSPANQIAADDFSLTDPKVARLFWWDPTLKDATLTGYKEFPNTPDFVPGRSMFLATRGSKNYDGSGFSTLQDTTIYRLLPGPAGDTIGIDYVKLVIDSGWNMIATPFSYTVNIESVDVIVAGDPTLYEQGDAERISRIGSKALRRLVPSGPDQYGYLPDSLLKPWRGYFLNNMKKERVTLLFPIQNDGLPSTVSESPKDYGLSLDWKISITAKSESRATFPTILGTAKEAQKDVDRMDLEVPPTLPGELRVVFRHGKEFGAAGDYVSDIRPPLSNDRETWDFAVWPGQTRAIELNFDGLAEAPSDYDVILTDKEGHASQNLRIEPVYRFITSVERHFTLTVMPKSSAGTVLMPTRYELYQNLPNPFNPKTLIKYDLPEAADVRLEVFNILGQKVATLVNQYEAAGPKSVLWGGTDEKGAGVASGIYFYKLSTKEFSSAKRMLFLK